MLLGLTMPADSQFNRVYAYSGCRAGKPLRHGRFAKVSGADSRPDSLA